MLLKLIIIFQNPNGKRQIPNNNQIKNIQYPKSICLANDVSRAFDF